MKRFYTIFSYIISLCLIIYFGGAIFLNNYFNNYFYKTPNLIGLTKSEAKKLIPKNTIIFNEIGKDYSKLPEGQIFMQEPRENKIVKRGRTIKVWVSLGENSMTIPDFKGKQLYEARNYLEEQGVKIKNITRIDSNLPYNFVIATTPSAGEIINTNEEISILVSNHASAKILKAPDLVGYTLEEATNILNENALFVGNIIEKHIPSLENNIVLNTSVEAGEDISAGSTINITINKK